MAVNRTVLKILAFALLMLTIRSSVSGQEARNAPAPEYVLRIEVEPGDRQYATAITNLLNRYVPVMERYFFRVLQDTISVRVVSPPEFQRRRLPSWAAAAYFPGQQQILVQKSGSGIQLALLERHFVHELSHLFFDRTFSRQAEIPLWYNEGLAETWRGCQIGFWEAAKLSYWLLSDNLLSLRQIGYLHRLSKSRAEQAYLESCLAVRFLHSYFGDAYPREQFYHDLETMGWKRAVFALTGLTEAEFEQTWREELARKYTWSIFLQLDSVLWIFMVVIVIISFFLKKLWNRRRLKAWEIEEQYREFGEQKTSDDAES